MALYRVKHKISIIASLDEDEKKIMFERAADTVIQTIRSDFTEGKAETRIVAKSATDEALAFGGIGTAKFLYMETDQLLTFKLNGGSESFKLQPTSGNTAKLCWEGEFTAITVTNPSADNDAEFTYCIAG